MNLNQVTLPVHSIPESVAFYKQLGFKQIVAAPHYVRFKSPHGEATFSLHLSEKTFSNGAVVYFECERLDRVVATLMDKGVSFKSQPTDQGWLWREARLCDPSGNELCLYWAGEHRLNPPWRLTE